MRGGCGRVTRALVIVLCTTSSASADPAAATAYAAGTTAYHRGDYATAIAAYEAAFRSDARAEVAFTLAQAHRNQYFIDKDVTHLHRALGLYRHYLSEAPNGRRASHARLHLETIEAILASTPQPATPVADKPLPTQLLVTADAPGARAAIDGAATASIPLVIDVGAGTHRVHVEAPGYDALELDALAVAERLVVVPASLRARPAQLVVRTSDHARITVDGRSVQATSQLAAGRHRVAIVARGKQPAVRDVELAAGATETIDVALASTTRRRVARWTLYGAAGLGGAALVAGGVTWFAQRDAESIYEHRGSGDDIDAYANAVDRRDTWRALSIGFATTAGIAGLTGAALWYFDLPDAPERAPVVTPIVGPETVGAAVAGRF
jgi:tetratricopeptide (TPR) repeat protein